MQRRCRNWDPSVQVTEQGAHADHGDHRGDLQRGTHVSCPSLSWQGWGVLDCRVSTGKGGRFRINVCGMDGSEYLPLRDVGDSMARGGHTVSTLISLTFMIGEL